jgi:integrase/recombinase XerD
MRDADTSGIAPNAKRHALAEAFDQETDPLTEYEKQFEKIEVDPFELFKTDVLASRDISQRTRTGYDRVFRQWKTFMAGIGRHPACPHHTHISRFARYELDEKGNQPQTVKEKLRKLRDAYSYWQADPSFPHPDEYRPFDLALSTTAFREPESKDFPHISLAALREQLAQVTHVRNLAIIGLQLKLGLRATELCNLTLAEIDVDHPAIADHYATLGADPRLTNYRNVVYITHERDGNKSRRPRLLPLDAETRYLLCQWLLVRPDADHPWVFLSLSRHEQLGKQDVNDIWKTAFHPDYAETNQHRAVTSHYGRHFFTTYWEVHQDLHRELVQYLRGDTPGEQSIDDRATIDEYLHTYYEDISDRYRADIFELEVC